MRPRVREHTWLTKENIIESKLIPFFGDMRMCDIRPVVIVRWQNSLTGSTRADGDGFKPTYLRIINNQLNPSSTTPSATTTWRRTPSTRWT